MSKMDPLESYTLEDLVSEKLSRRVPIKIYQIIEPPQEGKDSLMYVQKNLIWWIHIEDKYRRSEWLEEEKQKKRSREGEQCNLQSTGIQPDYEIQSRRKELEPVQKKTDNPSLARPENH